MKRISKKWAAAVTVTAVAVGVAGFGVAANASGVAPSFKVYDEADSPNPSYAAAGVLNAGSPAGLVFVKATDMGWLVGDAPIADVDSLSYTIASTTGSAPALQLVLSRTRGPNDKDTATGSYARISSAAAVAQGENADLVAGTWWSNQIKADQPGGIGNPQPFDFFQNGGGAGWTDVTVTAVDVHQGTSNDGTSLVSNVAFNGHSVPLGVFAQSDIDAATAPLNAEIAALTASGATKDGQITDLQADVEEKTATITNLQGEVETKTAKVASLQVDITEANATIDGLLEDASADAAKIADLQQQVADKTAQVSELQADIATKSSKIIDLQGDVIALQGQIADLQGQLATAKSDLITYKSTHHTADGTNFGVSRALLSATPVHGKTVGITKSGTIATSQASALKYQWYLSGKAIAGATKSTYLVPSSAQGKSVSVKVTATYGKYVVFAIHSNTLTAK